MALIAVAMNVLSAVSAFAAAVFWYLSARNKLPEMVSYWDGTPSDDPFFVAMQKGVTLNKWAAGFAGVSAICAAAATAASMAVSH
jgi:hypothetical protein